MELKWRRTKQKHGLKALHFSLNCISLHFAQSNNTHVLSISPLLSQYQLTWDLLVENFLHEISNAAKRLPKTRNPLKFVYDVTILYACLYLRHNNYNTRISTHRCVCVCAIVLSQKRLLNLEFDNCVCFCFAITTLFKLHLCCKWLYSLWHLSRQLKRAVIYYLSNVHLKKKKIHRLWKCP